MHKTLKVVASVDNSYCESNNIHLFTWKKKSTFWKKKKKKNQWQLNIKTKQPTEKKATATAYPEQKWTQTEQFHQQNKKERTKKTTTTTIIIIFKKNPKHNEWQIFHIPNRNSKGWNIDPF